MLELMDYRVVQLETSIINFPFNYSHPENFPNFPACPFMCRSSLRTAPRKSDSGLLFPPSKLREPIITQRKYGTPAFKVRVFLCKTLHVTEHVILQYAKAADELVWVRVSMLNSMVCFSRVETRRGCSRIQQFRKRRPRRGCQRCQTLKSFKVCTDY